MAFVKRRDLRWKQHVAERERLREERELQELEDRARREQDRKVRVLAMGFGAGDRARCLVTKRAEQAP